MWRRWRENRAVEQAVESLTGERLSKSYPSDPTVVFNGRTKSPHELKRWTDDRLYELVARPETPANTKLAAEAILRGREEWRGPKGYAIWISVVALAISATSLAVSLF